MQIEKPVILFDGFCNLCNGTVNFIHNRDKKIQFQYIPLQSETGKKLVAKRNLPSNIDSVIFIIQDRVFIKSDAIIEISRFLSFPWKIIRIGKFLPKKWRDNLYDFIATNRFKWFGKRDVCNLSTHSE